MHRKDIGWPGRLLGREKGRLTEQLVRRVDHGGAAVVADAGHAAQPDPAAGLQARDLRAAIEDGGQRAGRVDDLARQYVAIVPARADLRRMQPTLDNGPARLAQ
jgi:hypothetical protein